MENAGNHRPRWTALYAGLPVLLALLLADCRLQAAAVEHRLLELAIIALAALAGFGWIAANAPALARDNDEDTPPAGGAAHEPRGRWY